MPIVRHADAPVEESSSGQPGDDFLIVSMLSGDAAALRKLMDRYDRLVRYAVFRVSEDRCRRDPDWLDTIASDTWTGFVRSLQRDPGTCPNSVPAYLAQIARNRCVSALRRIPDGGEPVGLDDAHLPESTVSVDPTETLSKIEDMESLQGCLAELDGDDQFIVGQLTAITERRWRDAAAALNLSESTLRSRWKRTLGRLRRCMERKTGKAFAPRETPHDS